MMNKQSRLQRWGAWMLPGVLAVFSVGFLLLMASVGIVILGALLAYVSNILFQSATLGIFHYVLIVLAISCTAGLGIPILLLARNIQQSTENFSLLQFDEEIEDDDDYDSEDVDLSESDEELNEFLKNLHKSRNIGPFIPSPKTMEDLCPCGSGLKYKDCCGKFWN